MELKYKNGTPMRKYNSPKLQEIEMENKQTAVEWLIEQVESPNWLNLYAWHKKEVFEQAKQMEKQQIIDANYDGQRLHAKSVTNLMLQDNAESYYNETFGGNNEQQ